MINETKIQYVLIVDKLYKVTNINFSDLTLEAWETDVLVPDVSEDEVFRLEELSEFTIRLKNHKGMAEVIDFAEYVKNREIKS